MFLVLMSQGYVYSDHIYVPATYLEILQLEGGFFIFQEKDEAQRFHRNVSYPLNNYIVSFVTRSKNIHSNWIVNSTT